MNAFRRFIVLGMDDADRRVAAALRAQPLDETDRYLRSSVLMSTIDRLTRILQRWWRASEAARILWAVREASSLRKTPARDRAVAWLLIIAAATHVILMLAEGRPQGWFWIVLPAMTSLFAALLLAGTRSARSTD